MIDRFRLIRAVLGDDTAEGANKLLRFGAGAGEESFDDREYLQHFGFASRPLSGSEGIIIRQGNQFYMIATEDRRYRIPLQPGESAIYNDQGIKVHLKHSGIIEAGSLNGTKLFLVTADFIDWVKSHTHSNGNNGSPTGAPIQPITSGQYVTKVLKAE